MKYYTNFKQSSDIVAKEILGKKLITKIDGKITGGIIVETESYEGFNDPASHGYIGKTERNKPIFENGGIVYVYLIYGKFYLLNIVTSVKDFPSSVFIRAVEPTDGIELMQKRRQCKDINRLTNGPAKLTVALGINKNFNYETINKNKIFIINENHLKEFQIIATNRIGISKGKELLKRFYIKGNKWISKK